MTTAFEADRNQPTGPGNPDAFRALLRELLNEMSGRAAGLWRILRDRLELVAFTGCDALSPAVTQAFEDATRQVARDRTELSIVQAAEAAHLIVAEAVEWDAASGSGYWLRAFGAARSIAVPVFWPGVAGSPWGILSIALSYEVAPERVAAAIRRGFDRCVTAQADRFGRAGIDPAG